MAVACYQTDSHTNDKPVSFLNNIFNLPKTVCLGLCKIFVLYGQKFRWTNCVCVCPFVSHMITILWLCLKEQKVEKNFHISFHNILGMNWWQNGHVLEIDVELKQRCRICGAVDINFQKHTYAILFLCFHNITAAGRPDACYQSVTCLKVNCYLLQRWYGSLPSDSRHQGHRSSLLAFQVKFLPYWPASVATGYVSQWRIPEAWQHSLFCDRRYFALSEKPPIKSGLLKLFKSGHTVVLLQICDTQFSFIYACCCVMDAFQSCNETLSSIKCGNFLTS